MHPEFPFDPLFINFLMEYFKVHPEIMIPQNQIKNDMPSFYRRPELVSAGIQYLLRTGIIIHGNLDGKDHYMISREALKDLKLKKENEKINAEFDLEIKRRTLDSMKWQRWPQKYWYWVAFITYLGGIFTSIFTDVAKELILSEKQPTSIQQEQLLPTKTDTSQNTLYEPRWFLAPH